MAAILRDSTVVVVAAATAVVRTRPRAIPLATITMRKSAHGFPFVSHKWDAYGAPLELRYEVKNNLCLFEKPFKIQKNGVFLF